MWGALPAAEFNLQAAATFDADERLGVFDIIANIFDFLPCGASGLAASLCRFHVVRKWKRSRINRVNLYLIGRYDHTLGGSTSLDNLIAARHVLILPPLLGGRTEIEADACLTGFITTFSKRSWYL